MKKRKRKRERLPGLGIDAFGGGVIDPTENVKSLTEAANVRQDDLRALTRELHDTKIASLKEIGNIREKHQARLRKAEAARLDSIRQVDREESNKAATAAQTAIATLAAANLTTAETLRTQVATTAQAAATSLANSMGEVNKRLSALELSYSEGRGKATVESPMMAELVAEMKAMRLASAGNSGQQQGKQDFWGYIIGAVGLLGVIVTIAAALWKR